MKDEWLQENQAGKPGFAVVDESTARLVVVTGQELLIPAIVKWGHGFQVEVRPNVLLSAQFGCERYCARYKSGVSDMYNMKLLFWCSTAEVALMDHGRFMLVWGKKGDMVHQASCDPGIFVAVATYLASGSGALLPNEMQVLKYIVRHNHQPDRPEKLVELLGATVGV